MKRYGLVVLGDGCWEILLRSIEIAELDVGIRERGIEGRGGFELRLDLGKVSLFAFSRVPFQMLLA